MKRLFLEWRGPGLDTPHNREVRRVLPDGIPAILSRGDLFLDVSKVPASVYATLRVMVYMTFQEDKITDELINVMTRLGSPDWLDAYGLAIADQKPAGLPAQLSLF